MKEFFGLSQAMMYSLYDRPAFNHNAFSGGYHFPPNRSRTKTFKANRRKELKLSARRKQRKSGRANK